MKIFINSLILFVLSFIIHFVYELIPSTITSIFFPVNESIWEHMKIIFTSIIIFNLLRYIYYKIIKIEINNVFISIIITGILGIIIYLIIFIPIYLWIGHNSLISISLLYLVYIFVLKIDSNIIKLDKIKYDNGFFIVIIIVYIMFGYLTYKPIYNFLFYDALDEKYGINIYTK